VDGDLSIPFEWKIAEDMIDDNAKLFRDFELANEWRKEIKSSIRPYLPVS
jgi:hypothetical protein